MGSWEESLGDTLADLWVSGCSLGQRGGPWGGFVGYLGAAWCPLGRLRGDAGRPWGGLGGLRASLADLLGGSLAQLGVLPGGC